MHVVIADPGQQVPYYDRELASALVAEGALVTLVTAPMRHYDPGPVADGVAVRQAFGRLLTGPLGNHSYDRPLLRRAMRAAGYAPELAAFVRWVSATRPTAVHLQWSLAPSVDARALARARRAGAVTAYTAHNVLPHEPTAWLSPKRLGRLYRSVDRIVVHSRATGARLLSTFPQLDADAVSVIAMPAGRSDVAPLGRLDARAALGLSPTRPIALFFGHVRPYKGVDVLIDAAPLVRRSVPECLIAVVGAVRGGRAGAESLRDAVAARGVAANVTVRAGYVPHELARRWFEAADVVVLPYRDCDDSAVLATARMSGRAVVATAVGGLPEALATGGGILVPPCDAVALAAALTSVLSDTDLRARLEREAESAACTWTWADAARQHMDLYRTARERAA